MSAPAGGHVAVFVLPDYGHVNPTFEITRHLVERGHRVTYVLTEDYRPAVAAAGAGLVAYDTARRRLGAGHVDADRISELGLDILADTTARVLPAARAGFTGADRPDLILYEFESFVAARILAREWGCPTLQFFPYLASNDQYSLHAEIFDPDSPAVHHGVEEILRVLATVEPDPAAQWAMMAPFDERNLALLPQALQPRGETFDERFTFVGHCLPQRPPAAAWEPPGPDVSVALVSMGTESNDRDSVFRLCADAFSDKDWHVVMTLGRGKTLGADLAAVNIEAHEWLPHLAVLPHAAVLVCHGGMGSILEALYFGRPVVVVPHTPEHVVNGRRLAELGVGRMLPSGDVDPGTLRAVVDELAGDPATMIRVGRLSEQIRAGGGAARAADVVEHLLRARP
ncbi:glycosyltransferase [Dactylosporangium fulvum]|uniref:Glycosyl transferase n=1 Tax=Dactylosporangium fulvum TaxID=53359 RepID=A0ABY5VPV2_9ACTN|nr:macrolide family glycosyltransferase [Dactylosporangium fulvum]UWP79212.1 glycosyl transferase [Dactylosporangium fulvum]